MPDGEIVVRVEMLDSEYVRGIVFAAVDLLREVLDGDEALMPDSVLASARVLEAKMERGTFAPDRGEDEDG